MCFRSEAFLRARVTHEVYCVGSASAPSSRLIFVGIQVDSRTGASLFCKKKTFDLFVTCFFLGGEGGEEEERYHV